jgi:outer membrane receptor protein involved in Fe transport
MDLPSEVAANCSSDQHGGTNRCPTAYSTGGPGALNINRYDSIQGRAVLTFLFQGAGHHVLKLGVDGDVSTTERVRAVSGHTVVVETAAGRALIDGTHWGYLVGPNTEVDFNPSTRSRSVFLGSFIQDSWSIVDRITLNAGVRYDTQTLYGTDGQVAVSFPHEWSPRVGLIWDPTQEGRAKLYANYARYYENMPLDAADREFGQDLLVRAWYARAGGDCNPRNPITTSCVTPDNLLSRWIPPNPNWVVRVPNVPVVVDPSLEPSSQDEWVAGIEYELLHNTRASLAYTHRQIVSWVEDMSFNNGGTYFLGNPGRGVGAVFPSPHRVYNAFVVSLNKMFADLWIGQISYSYQNLKGNIEGLYRQQNGQLDPNINSDFDLQRLQANRDGPLAGDIRHTIKAYLAKQFLLSPTWSVTLGAGYTGSSGPPIDFVGASSLYGDGETYIFSRGAAGRLGWVHSVDVNGAVTLRFSGTTALTLSVNVFNLFNFQQVTGVDNNYTYYPYGVAPVPNGNPATDKAKIVDDVYGQPIPSYWVNRNFLQPAAYQPVRQVRFQARVSF